MSVAKWGDLKREGVLIKCYSHFLGKTDGRDLGGDFKRAGGGGIGIKNGLAGIIGGRLDVNSVNSRGEGKINFFLGDTDTAVIQKKNSQTDFFIAVGFGGERRGKEIGVLNVDSVLIGGGGAGGENSSAGN